MWVLNQNETKLVFAKSIECKIEYTKEDEVKINKKFLQLRGSVDKIRGSRMPVKEAEQKAFEWAESEGIKMKYIVYVNGEIFDEYEFPNEFDSKLPTGLIKKAVKYNMTFL